MKKVINLLMLIFYSSGPNGSNFGVFAHFELNFGWENLYNVDSWGKLDLLQSMDKWV